MSAKDFERVVVGAMSPDNSVRAQAEAVFQRARQHPDSFFTLLSQLMQSSSRPDVCFEPLLARVCVYSFASVGEHSALVRLNPPFLLLVRCDNFVPSCFVKT